MKISFYSDKNNNRYARKIIAALESHVSHHQYNHYADSGDTSADLYHCLSLGDSFGVVAVADRTVLSLSDLRFVTSPHLFSLVDRLFKLPLYRYHCRHVARIVTSNSVAKDLLVSRLGIDESRVQVCPSLMAVQREIDGGVPTSEELLRVRAKLQLSDSYVLIVGDIDTMHGQAPVLHSVLEMPQKLNVVVYGRRTTHADVLLQMVRDVGAADRVEFVYEMDSCDLNALYRMALAVVYTPMIDDGVIPIVRALHQRVPMLLSPTIINREAAGEAAVYVDPYDKSELDAALKELVYNESYRGQLIAQCWVESRRFSEENMAEMLAQIYESV